MIMKRLNKPILIIFLVLVVLGLSILLLPPYARKALIYQKPGIDDYTIFSNRTIKAGKPQPWEQAGNYNQAKLDKAAVDSFEKYQTVAFLIVKDGKLLFEEYWDGYGAESMTNSFSMSKSIIGLLIGAAVDDGYIKSLEQPVADFIPEFRNPANQGLKIKDVLTMSSGLNWKESYGGLFNTTTEAYYGKDIKKLIYSLKVTSQPGVQFSYLSGNTELLAMIVEKATGKSISEYTSLKFWKPMGAEHDALWCLDDKDGMEKAYCCFNSNARDFARWGQLILNQGTWNGDTLISPVYIRQSITPNNHLTDETGQPVNYYGYQWWIINYNGHQVPYMRGILGQYIFVIPDENAVVVRLGHKRSEEKHEHHPADAWIYLNEAFRIIEGAKAN
jgi:CubicO group peptidase (beta-lactamase class C family)